MPRPRKAESAVRNIKIRPSSGNSLNRKRDELKKRQKRRTFDQSDTIDHLVALSDRVEGGQ